MQNLFRSGLALHQRGDLAGAEAVYRQVLAAVPRHFDALHLTGVIHAQRREFTQAVELLQAALAVDPSSAAAWGNLGAALLDLGRPGDALVALDRAQERQPGGVQTHHNRGLALRALGRMDLALAEFETTVRLDGRHLHGRCNLGRTLSDLRRHAEAASQYQVLLDMAPDYPFAKARLLQARLLTADWRDVPRLRASLIADLRGGRPAGLPHWFLSLSDRIDEQRQCAERFVSAEFPSAHCTPLWTGQRRHHQRLRVAYLSADFRDHAVAHLMVGVLEAHDRSQVEVIGVQLQPGDGSAMEARMRGAVDQLLDATALDDRQVAHWLHQRGIDVAVDLTGHTSGCRPRILAWRPAPVQIAYLGYPGPMGAPWIDFQIADAWLVPPTLRHAYAERFIELPECFQANDARRQRPDARPDRARLGLPAGAFVFCSFNNTFKLNPELFGHWMRILQQCPGSVLWMLAEGDAAQQSLRQHARAQGVDAERLVFAGRESYAAHLTRLQAADLFLDAFPFNGGTTVSDALWAGVPVLSCSGEAMSARMGGSLLQAAGLPELVVQDMPAYVDLALALAADPVRLAGLRARLEAVVRHGALFDTTRFCRHLEEGFRLALRQVLEVPARTNIRVSALPRAGQAEQQMPAGHNSDIGLR